MPADGERAAQEGVAGAAGGEYNGAVRAGARVECPLNPAGVGRDGLRRAAELSGGRGQRRTDDQAGRGSRGWPTGRGSPVATESCRGADADPAGPACTAPTGAAGTARMTSAAAPAAASQENRILIDVSRVRLRTESVSLSPRCCIKSTFTAKIRYSRRGQPEELGTRLNRRSARPGRSSANAVRPRRNRRSAFAPAPRVAASVRALAR